MTNCILTEAQREAFQLTEDVLRRCVAYADAYGGPVVDGSQYSPSDRAIGHVERVWRSSTAEQWEHFEWALQDLYDTLELTWVDGMLWRVEDVPSDV